MKFPKLKALVWRSLWITLASIVFLVACCSLSLVERSLVLLSKSETLKCERCVEVNIFNGVGKSHEEMKTSGVLSNQTKLELCPQPKDIINLGPVSVWTLPPEDGQVEPGGRYKPKGCRARHKVAVLVPYRNRRDQLNKFLYHIHHFLQMQYLDYGIFIIEQTWTSEKFNRAKLFNIGYIESLKEDDWDSFIFHDIDLLPINSMNMYFCLDNQPRHMSVAVDRFNFKLLYEGQFGGVSCMTGSTFRDVNGFSNAYFGWGGEDDDMATRISAKGLKRVRYPPHISTYIMMSHPKSRDRANISTLNYAAEMMEIDGVPFTKYNLKNVSKSPLYTNIKADFPNDGEDYIRLIRNHKLRKQIWRPNRGKVVYDKMNW